MCTQPATASTNRQNHGTRFWRSFSPQATGGVLFVALVLAVLCLPSSVAAQTFIGDDDGDGQIVFDDFEDGIQTGPDEYFTFAGSGAAINLAESSDVPSESSGTTALSAAIDGGDGGGFAGYGKGTSSDAEVNGVDVSDLGDDPYFTMYIQSDATTEYTLEINLQEDQDGNGTFDGGGATDDEFQYNYTVSPSDSNYTRISIPFSSFFDDNAVNTGGDGVLSDRIANVVFAIGGLPANSLSFTVDDILYSDTDLGDGDGNDGPDFRGDDDGDGILALDFFEDGIQTDPDEYFTFAGDGAAISLAESSDVPAESGGSTALAATVDGGDGGSFAGYGKGVASEVEVQGLDLSALGSDPYFTMYIQSDATTEYTLEINLQEDQNGNGTFDSGSDDEFQFAYTVDPAASGYDRINVQLSSFSDDEAVNPGGDGVLSDRIANVVFAIGGLPAETFTFTIDDLGFTDDGSLLPVELVGFDVRADGADALLTWQTASETHNARFDVQVASGAAPFRTVGSVRGAGTTTEAQDYHFRVVNLTPGTHRFRLRQVDLDGTTTLSDVQTLSLSVTAPFTVIQPTANPIHSGQTATLKYAVQDREPVQVELYNVLGQRVRVLRDGWSTPGAVATVRIPTTDLASGRYFLRITGRSFSETQTVSVVR